MLHKQKEVILLLVEHNQSKKNWESRYWFLYKDFLDPADAFTDFSCERHDGKLGYIALIESLLNKDRDANIFVEVYGIDGDDKDVYIYADTLFIFSKLSLPEIKEVFNKPNDIFPSDVGEIKIPFQQIFVIGDNGDLIPATKFFKKGDSVYYCWWD